MEQPTFIPLSEALITSTVVPADIWLVEPLHSLGTHCLHKADLAIYT